MTPGEFKYRIVDDSLEILDEGQFDPDVGMTVREQQEEAMVQHLTIRVQIEGMEEFVKATKVDEIVEAFTPVMILDSLIDVVHEAVKNYFEHGKGREEVYQAVQQYFWSKGGDDE
jgi:hypothetical protein